jgi:hypothetical protein
VAECGRALDRRALDGTSTRHHHLLHLKRAYRRITVDDRPGVRPFYLKGDGHLIQERIVYRLHRYMPPTLLHSKFETLEEPGEDEHPVFVTIRGSLARGRNRPSAALDTSRRVSAVFDVGDVGNGARLCGRGHFSMASGNLRRSRCQG